MMAQAVWGMEHQEPHIRTPLLHLLAGLGMHNKGIHSTAMHNTGIHNKAMYNKAMHLLLHNTQGALCSHTNRTIQVCTQVKPALVLPLSQPILLASLRGMLPWHARQGQAQQDRIVQWCNTQLLPKAHQWHTSLRLRQRHSSPWRLQVLVLYKRLRLPEGEGIEFVATDRECVATKSLAAMWRTKGSFTSAE